MKKILIYILLLANLGAGFAFAQDTHPQTIVNHEMVEIHSLASSDHDHADDDLHHTDHCCHGSAHLVGLILSQHTLFMTRSHYEFFMLSLAPHMLYISPLLRPPIA